MKENELTIKMMRETLHIAEYEEYEEDLIIRRYVTPKAKSWVTFSPEEIFYDLGFDLGPDRSDELEDIIDGNISGFYYIYNLRSEEAIKWLMGHVAAELKIRKLPFSQVSRLIPADYLAEFADRVSTGLIPRQFSKDILNEIMNRGEQFIDNCTFEEYEKYDYEFSLLNTILRMKGSHVLDVIMAQEKYKTVDDSEVDIVIQKVISDNAGQFEKAKSDPRLVNWFVGQCMKQLKGKASPQELGEKIRTLIG